MKKSNLFQNKNEFQGSNFKSHKVELEFLQNLGFATNPFNKEITGLDNIWNYAQEINQKRENLNYPIDGLVVKIDDNILSSKLGVVGKTPRGWCAIKFAAKESTTKICGITWQVGRTGKITPVAELEATELAGTTVQRASLHNYNEVKEKNYTMVIHLGFAKQEI
ncbi:hypothetical protein HC766_02670 [Candidatus Gracilibacteria bacterium]|nr:hypothetical protein [Candidatus Gracilibacteria bacterium]